MQEKKSEVKETSKPRKLDRVEPRKRRRREHIDVVENVKVGKNGGWGGRGQSKGPRFPPQRSEGVSRRVRMFS